MEKSGKNLMEKVAQRGEEGSYTAIYWENAPDKRERPVRGRYLGVCLLCLRDNIRGQAARAQ